MYEIYQDLLDQKKLKNSDVSRGTGISNMTLSDWKNGKTTPNSKNMQKIANFLDVSVDYLMTGKENTFVESQAEIDFALARQNERVKEYMLKFAKLSDDKRNQIMSLIDMLEDK